MTTPNDRDRPEPVAIVWRPAPDATPVDRVVVAAPNTTMDEVLGALGAAEPGDAMVDGRCVAATATAASAGLRRGSVLTPHGPCVPPVPAVVEVAVVAGVGAGRLVPLDAGSWHIGRSRHCAVVLEAASVSFEHAALHIAADGQVSITDLGSTNGTWVDGICIDGPAALTPDTIVRVGAVQLAVRPPATGGARLGPRRPDGTRAFNRPPRPALPAPPAALRLPAARPEPASRPRLPWAALIAPLVMGIGMAVLYDPRFAAFALFSPVMMVGTWFEERRRARRDDRNGAQRLDEQLEDLAAALAEMTAAERRRARRVGGDPANALALASATSTRLWERRSDDRDFLAVSLGLGSIRWRPPISGDGVAAPEATALVDDSSHLDEVPVAVDLSPGNACGLVGPSNVGASAAASLLVQVAAHHGPADVRIAVLTDADRVAAWEWVKWLPHTGSTQLPTGSRLLTADADGARAVADAIREGRITTVVVVDSASLLDAHAPVVRDLLACEHVSAVVCSPDTPSLPAACTIVVECDDQAVGRVSYRGGDTVDDVLVAGVAPETARATALALAGLDDPETAEAGAALPQTVSLPTLLGGDICGATLLQRWAQNTRPCVPIGVDDNGTVMLDLAADGPHGLIAGTTGAGKSELLRTVVAGLAATLSPAELTFVLIDYKGGSAFDACAALPHTVGMVTDLDESLGRRALRCLEAELRYRERALRDAGAVDLEAYRARIGGGNAQPLPRLIVAVDEFATLAAELPDFIDRLVSVAQRGRSLGVHLLLATQRPAGAVSDNIRANTNLRIALRVQDAADSADVIGSPAAASISRRRPGRGYLRRGHAEVLAFQAASISGATDPHVEAVTAHPFPGTATAPVDDLPAENTDASDLQRLVAAAQEAFASTGMAPPRRPWPDPLPAALPRAALPSSVDGCSMIIGLADDPDVQRSIPYEIDLTASGLLLYGALSAGPTAALATIALGAGHVPDVDCYVIDAGNQSLAPLADLPHVGAVVPAGDRVRQERLLRFLADEVARRREQSVAGVGRLGPSIVLLLDNYAGFAAAFDDLEGLAVLDLFTRLVADGPSLGITVAASADRVNALPPATAATIARRLLFRLPDRHDYAQFGVALDWSGDLPPNRAIDAGTGLQVQLTEPPPSLAEAVAQFAGVRRDTPPQPIRVLPAHVALTSILGADEPGTGDWFLPLGLDDRSVAPAGWHLGAGDHALVTGPARSGKSTVLTTVAQIAAKTRSDVLLYGVALRRSPLRDSPCLDAIVTTPEALDGLLRQIRDDPRPALLLVDDADGVDDAGGLLTALLATRRDDLWCIAAGRADVLRTQYGHWTAEVRRTRLGLALRPNLDLDGDLWHTPLPRRRRDSLPPGRGYLIADGTAELLQAATP